MIRKSLAQIQIFGLALSFLTLFAFSIADNVRGAIYPDLLSHFQVGGSRGSLFFLIASGVAVAQQFLVPRLLQKWSSRFAFLYILYLLLMGVGPGLQFFSSLLPSSTLSFAILLVGSFLFGLGMGGSSILHGLLLQASVPSEKLSKAFSILHSLYGAGALLSPFIVTGFRELQSPWAASLGLVFFVSLLLTGMALVGKSQIQAPEALRYSSATDQIAPPSSFTKGVIFSLLFCVSTEILLSSRMTLYLREVLAFEPQKAELYLGGFFLNLFLGRLFAAFFLTKKSYISIGRLLGFLMLLSTTLGFLIDPLFWLLTGFLMGPLFPLSLSELSQRNPGSFGRDSSLLYGWVGIGIFAMHGLFGLIADEFGLEAAMRMSLGMTTLSFIGYLGLERFSNRASRL